MYVWDGVVVYRAIIQVDVVMEQCILKGGQEGNFKHVHDKSCYPNQTMIGICNICDDDKRFFFLMKKK